LDALDLPARQITAADIRQALDAAAVVGDDFQRNAAGELDARLLGATAAVADDRLPAGQAGVLRHLERMTGGR
jgi:hypothetical protein